MAPGATVYVPPVRVPEALSASTPESTWIVPPLFANGTDTSDVPLDFVKAPVLTTVPEPV